MLQELFQIPLDPDQVIELDSTTATKYSRHLIIPLREAAFANNSHAGAFVSGVLSAASESDAEKLYLFKVRCHALAALMPALAWCTDQCAKQSSPNWSVPFTLYLLEMSSVVK